MLPDAWVNSLFARLAVRYGREWLAKWEGLDIAAVKADWAEELGGFTGQPEAIKYGLDHLPDRPPTVIQFRDLCRRSPPAPAPRLPAPKATAEVVAKAVEQLVKVAKRPASTVGRKWAEELKQRMDAGYVVPVAHRQMVSEALDEGRKETE